METWYLYIIYIFASIALVGFCLNAIRICFLPMIRLTTKQHDITNHHCRNIIVVQHQAEHPNNNSSVPSSLPVSYITLEIPPPKYEDAIQMPPGSIRI